MNKSDYNIFGDEVKGFSISARQKELVDGDRYTRHALVCTDSEPEMCFDKGGNQIKKTINQVLDDHHRDDIKITPVRSLGYCQRGPVAVVYPEGIWYEDLTPRKARQITRQHLIHGSRVNDYTFIPNHPSEHTHILICTFLSGCGPEGGAKALQYFRNRSQGRSEVTVTQAHGCLWDCSMGPLLVTYPSGHWYARLQQHKYEDIWNAEVEQDEAAHFVSGKLRSTSQSDPS